VDLCVFTDHVTENNVNSDNNANSENNVNSENNAL